MDLKHVLGIIFFPVKLPWILESRSSYPWYVGKKYLKTRSICLSRLLLQERIHGLPCVKIWDRNKVFFRSIWWEKFPDKNLCTGYGNLRILHNNILYKNCLTYKKSTHHDMLGCIVRSLSNIYDEVLCKYN